MIFRLTQKASKKLRVHCDQLDGSGTSMLEWYCNLAIVERRQLFLFTQATTLFSFWCPAAGCTRNDFGPMFRRRMAETLTDYGFDDDAIVRLVDDGPDTYASSADRGVIGSMVDYVKMLQYVANYEGGLERLSQRQMNDIANECPMSKIDGNAPSRYLRQLLETKGTG